MDDDKPRTVLGCTHLTVIGIDCGVQQHSTIQGKPRPGRLIFLHYPCKGLGALPAVQAYPPASTLHQEVRCARDVTGISYLAQQKVGKPCDLQLKPASLKVMAGGNQLTRTIGQPSFKSLHFPCWLQHLQHHNLLIRHSVVHSTKDSKVPVRSCLSKHFQSHTSRTRNGPRIRSAFSQHNSTASAKAPPHALISSTGRWWGGRVLQCCFEQPQQHCSCYY